MLSYVLSSFLRIHRMLDAQSDLRLPDAHRPLQFRPVGLGAQAQHHDDARKQLHQPVRLRRQVPRVQDGPQTHAA